MQRIGRSIFTPPSPHKHTHTRTRTHTHTQTHTHTHTHAHTHTYIHTHTSTLALTHSHTHTLTHTYTHSHTHTETHKHISFVYLFVCLLLLLFLSGSPFQELERFFLQGILLFPLLTPSPRKKSDVDGLKCPTLFDFTYTSEHKVREWRSIIEIGCTEDSQIRGPHQFPDVQNLVMSQQTFLHQQKVQCFHSYDIYTHTEKLLFLLAKLISDGKMFCKGDSFPASTGTLHGEIFVQYVLRLSSGVVFPAMLPMMA